MLALHTPRFTPPPHAPPATPFYYTLVNSRLDSTRLCSRLYYSPARRDFWLKNYSAIKTANANLPILLRENAGTPAKLTAAFREPLAPQPSQAATPALLVERR